MLAIGQRRGRQWEQGPPRDGPVKANNVAISSDKEDGTVKVGIDVDKKVKAELTITGMFRVIENYH